MAQGSRPPAWGALRGAVVWQALLAELGSPAHDPAAAVHHILDAGGGTGGFAVPLAQHGHQLTVVDPSPDSLAALARRAAEADVVDQVRGIQGDLSALAEVVPPGSFDAVLCHSVLEVVEDPEQGLRAAAAALRAGGLLSLLVAARGGAVLGRAVSGRFGDAAVAYADLNGTWGQGDTVLRRYDVAELTALVEQAGLRVRAVHGVRVFTDLVPGAMLDADPAATEALVRLESAVSADPAFHAVAAQLHVLARSS